MTDTAFLDTQIGFYRRANGKRPWREERLGAVLEMIRNGDLWEPGDRLLVGPDRPGDGTGRSSGG